jgi:hypothetical protein
MHSGSTFSSFLLHQDPAAQTRMLATATYSLLQQGFTALELPLAFADLGLLPPQARGSQGQQQAAGAAQRCRQVPAGSIQLDVNFTSASGGAESGQAGAAAAPKRALLLTSPTSGNASSGTSRAGRPGDASDGLHPGVATNTVAPTPTDASSSSSSSSSASSSMGCLSMLPSTTPLDQYLWAVQWFVAHGLYVTLSSASSSSSSSAGARAGPPSVLSSPRAFGAAWAALWRAAAALPNFADDLEGRLFLQPLHDPAAAGFTWAAGPPASAGAGGAAAASARARACVRTLHLRVHVRARPPCPHATTKHTQRARTPRTHTQTRRPGRAVPGCLGRAGGRRAGRRPVRAAGRAAGHRQRGGRERRQLGPRLCHGAGHAGGGRVG